MGKQKSSEQWIDWITMQRISRVNNGDVAARKDALDHLRSLASMTRKIEVRERAYAVIGLAVDSIDAIQGAGVGGHAIAFDCLERVQEEIENSHMGIETWADPAGARLRFELASAAWFAARGEWRNFAGAFYGAWAMMGTADENVLEWNTDDSVSSLRKVA